jgi:hypothetical protein
LPCRQGYNENDQPIEPVPTEWVKKLGLLEDSSVEALRRNRMIFVVIFGIISLVRLL